MPPHYKYYSCVVQDCPGRLTTCNKTNSLKKKLLVDHDHCTEKNQSVLNEMRVKTQVMKMAADEKFDKFSPHEIIVKASEFVGDFTVKKQKMKLLRRAIENKRVRRKIRRPPLLSQIR